MNYAPYVNGRKPVDKEILSELIGFNLDVTKLDTSKITDMGYLFFFNQTFNQDIKNWDLSNADGVEDMFLRCNDL